MAAWVGAAACVLVTVVGVLVPPGATAPVAATLTGSDLPHAWAAGIVLVLALVSAAALIELARMLGQVREHALFAPAATRHFRHFAGLLALAAALRVVLPAFAAIAAARQAGRHAATLTFDGGDLLALLITAVFFLVARLFDEAARLEDDSRSIV
ncbi:DUF2975 domain-containing protein [Rhodanobacter sp. 7MK24]|uniref:DUF2975 domain-containing protein n=1 Tax=Rhodanobacter sp. 7MK24 TaxID=2775922 RepID=UPI0017838DCA|nr:DUF2975 domain-containing protein [Rhodanobacter sp. 7MK24]MBD8880487.1 DUF2975 domain-containing protein [Rhodanobacter sp. 7MK24]